MKAYIVAAVMLLVGIGLGATVRAQGKQHVYVIYQTQLTGDIATYARDYVAHIPATLAPFGGHFLVRGGKVTRLEGDAPLPRVSIIEFDSLEKAQGWYNSPAYQKLIPVRQSVMKTISFITEKLRLDTFASVCHLRCGRRLVAASDLHPRLSPGRMFRNACRDFGCQG